MEIVKIIVVIFGCLASSLYCVYMLQAGRYQLPLYRNWVRRNRDRFIKANIVVGILCALLNGYLPVLLALFMSVEGTRRALADWLVLLGFAGTAAATVLRLRQTERKSAPAFTLRIRRLYAVLAVLFTALALLTSLLHVSPYIAYAVVPYVVWLGGTIIEPLENRINAGFYNEAKRKLRARSDLITIGITGSCGKTLTKFILKGILSQKYKVLATPASFNTAMGISRVVNDQLEKQHEVFIAEMGAQHVGDIRNLVNLVRPKYGLITSIGPQHLDSFGSMANIIDTKYELISGLPQDGVAFFASDSGYIDRMYGKCSCEKYNAAVNPEVDAYMRAVDMYSTAQGTQFTLVCADGTSVRCRTRLLGRCNVLNIALAATVAKRLGMTMEEIGHAIAKLQTFERKLQLIPGDRVVIDDTLNRSAAGAAEALNVLAEMPGRRIVVTPGLPVPENDAEDTNFAFGTQINGCADAVVLVGKRAKVRPIQKGLLSSGFPKGSIHVIEDEADVDDLLGEISGSGDSILYESSEEE